MDAGGGRCQGGQVPQPPRDGEAVFLRSAAPEFFGRCRLADSNPAEYSRPRPRAAAALELTRLMGYLLYNVSPRDPWAFGSAFAVIAVASLAACLVPAWRATRTDPLQALRA